MIPPKRLCAVLCLGLVAIVGLGGQSRAETFEIGVVSSLSGGGADYGIAFLNGIKLAVEQANKAGGVSVGGRTYTVSPVACDEEGKPDKAVNCGKELAAEHKVRVVMTPSSLAAFPMMGFNQQEGFILMATSQTPKFTKIGDKLAVRFVNNTDKTMGPWVDLVNAYFKKTGQNIDKVAMMLVNTELGKTWADNFAKSWKTRSGAAIEGTASYDANDTDFYPQLSTLLPNEPDAIVLTTVCQPSAIVIKQARELGFKGPFIQSAACSGEGMLKLLSPGQADGSVFEIGAWGLDTPSITAFKKAYQAAFNILPQSVSGSGYDGARWVMKAVEDAGTVDDATKIRASMPAALSGTKNMFNMANLDANGDVDFPMYVGVVDKGQMTVFTGDK